MIGRWVTDIVPIVHQAELLVVYFLKNYCYCLLLLLLLVKSMLGVSVNVRVIDLEDIGLTYQTLGIFWICYVY